MKPPEVRKVHVLKLRGELNLEDVLKIREMIGVLLQDGQARVVLDLTEVPHIHLVALPVLVERAKYLRDYKGDLKLCGVSPYLLHILQLAGADTAFDIQPNMDAATARFT